MRDVVHVGPITEGGIEFPHMNAEEFTDGDGYAPNPFGRWVCACGWSAEWRMGSRSQSRAMSPEALELYHNERNRALWHADRCPSRPRAVLGITGPAA